MTTIHLFGIRHHGPGCARSLLQALEQLQPDVILIEGPPEANELLSLAASPAMVPPVALLLYAAQSARHACYYPFAAFSPEWQAILYGHGRGVPTRFIDLPQSIQFAQALAREALAGEAIAGEASPDHSASLPDDAPLSTGDALGWLAQAAGFSDTDTWWDHLVEQRRDGVELFEAIETMMGVARQDLGAALSEREAQREAHMRQMIRAAEKEGFARIAVICGAWHVPALRTMPAARADTELLKGLPRTRVHATWVPWTYGRLSYQSGYGAGIEAPGWYRHLWLHPEKAGLHWLTDAATLLRKHDLDASSAHVIEAFRLAESLTALRMYPRVGLAELQDALRAVYLGEHEAPLKLIERELMIADELGQVPPETPQLPLQLDVQALQKRLRMPMRAEPVSLELDVREPVHREKSVLLYRLKLLGIAWGRSQHVHGKSGGFHEHWSLQWQPEFDLKLIEANVWGTTLEAAATAKLQGDALAAHNLPDLTKLAHIALDADLAAAIETILERLQELAAHTDDAGLMLAALPSLAKILRYGNTRNTAHASVALVMQGLVTRSCLALPQAASGINGDGASELMQHIIGGDQALRLLQDDALLRAWTEALQIVATRSSVHPLIAGRATRILTEQGCWTLEQTAQALSLACTHVIQAEASAAWLEGFLSGSGLVLVSHDELWPLVDQWLCALPETAFIELLPLLRRTFSTFEAPERRQIGERVAHGVLTLGPNIGMPIDEPRAARTLPILKTLLLAELARTELA